MTEHRDPRVWLEQCLWFDAGEQPDEATLQRELAQIQHRATAAERPRGRRARWTLVGGVAVLAIAGATTAAALWLAGQPTAPEAGIVCRAAVELDADAFVLPPDADPVAACANAWASRRPSDDTTAVPPSVACIGPNGAIEVFPSSDACEVLGLDPAAIELTPDNQAILALNDRVIEEINLGECRPASEVVVVVEQMLAESPLEGWRVVSNAEGAPDACGMAAIESTTKTVIVYEIT